MGRMGVWNLDGRTRVGHRCNRVLADLGRTCPGPQRGIDPCHTWHDARTRLPARQHPHACRGNRVDVSSAPVDDPHRSDAAHRGVPGVSHAASHTEELVASPHVDHRDLSCHCHRCPRLASGDAASVQRVPRSRVIPRGSLLPFPVPSRSEAPTRGRVGRVHRDWDSP